MSVFKNKADQGFYEALREHGASRKSAFAMTVASREHRALKHDERLLHGLTWGLHEQAEQVYTKMTDQPTPDSDAVLHLMAVQS